MVLTNANSALRKAHTSRNHLGSTFLLLPSPREVSEIENLEILPVTAGKVGAFHRVPLASSFP